MNDKIEQGYYYLSPERVFELRELFGALKASMKGIDHILGINCMWCQSPLEDHAVRSGSGGLYCVKCASGLVDQGAHVSGPNYDNELPASKPPGIRCCVCGSDVVTQNNGVVVDSAARGGWRVICDACWSKNRQAIYDSSKVDCGQCGKAVDNAEVLMDADNQTWCRSCYDALEDKTGFHQELNPMETTRYDYTP